MYYSPAEALQSRIESVHALERQEEFDARIREKVPPLDEFRIVEDCQIPGAVQGLYTPTDVRAVDDPLKLGFQAHEWYEHGTNHRVVRGHICRDFPPRPAWYIQIPNLVAFLREHGRCLFGVDFFGQPWVRLGDDE